MKKIAINGSNAPILEEAVRSASMAMRKLGGWSPACPAFFLVLPQRIYAVLTQVNGVGDSSGVQSISTIHRRLRREYRRTHELLQPATRHPYDHDAP